MADAIRSALAQTYPEFEIVVVDDGSQNHTPASRLVLQRLLEDGMADTRPGYSLDYCATTSVDLYGAIFQSIINATERRRVFDRCANLSLSPYSFAVGERENLRVKSSLTRSFASRR